MIRALEATVTKIFKGYICLQVIAPLHLVDSVGFYLDSRGGLGRKIYLYQHESIPWANSLTSTDWLGRRK